MKRKFSLRRTWGKMRTVPGLGRNVAAVTGVIVLGTTTLAIVFANVKFIPPWDDRMTLQADFAEASAVVPEQNPKVRIAGVDVGQIVDSEVTEKGHARLTFSIQPGHDIYRDAQVSLRPKSAVNEMYVNITPGTRAAGKVKDGDVIPVGQTERPVQVDEVLGHLDERTRDSLTNLLAVSDAALANAPENLPAGLRATNATIREFAPVVQKLEQRRANIRQLVSALSQIAGAVGDNRERSAVLANSMEDVLGTLAERDDELVAVLKELPGTSDELRAALTDLDSLTGQLNPTLDNVERASKRLPGTLRKLTRTMAGLGDTVDAARPVLAKARPVARDLRPLVRDVNGALTHLGPLTAKLKPATKTLVPYLNDLAAFIYNTSSVFSAADANGGTVRGHLVSPPYGGPLPGAGGGNPDPTAPDGER